MGTYMPVEQVGRHAASSVVFVWGRRTTAPLRAGKASSMFLVVAVFVSSIDAARRAEWCVRAAPSGDDGGEGGRGGADVSILFGAAEL